MANPVCEVLVTDAQLSAPEIAVDPAAGAKLISRGSFVALRMGAENRGNRLRGALENGEHQLRGNLQSRQ